MPRATYDPTKTKDFDLESLEGGTVTLKKMSYGQRVKVREMSLQLTMQGKSDVMDLEMTQMRVDEFEFANSIVEHNLEDEAGLKLDFKKASVVASLDPAIGTEISKLIADFNAPVQDPKGY